MNRISIKRSARLCGVAGTAGVLASGLFAAAPASAQPRVPDDVWVQCSGFTAGPGSAFPHPLTGCVSRSGTGSGFTDRSTGTETIFWNQPFEGGKSLTLVNPRQTAPEEGTTCPEGTRVRIGVAGEIGPRQQYAGSPITATICVQPDGSYFLATGSLWTIRKVPGSPGDVNPPA